MDIVADIFSFIFYDFFGVQLLLQEIYYLISVPIANK